MAKKYLTISEFAKLRNVNINSLRYYEKLGILKPAWTDPKTKYRYYLPEQINVLDVISLCIHFGIPLKELKGYIDQSGSLNGKEIFGVGKNLIEKRILNLKLGLDVTEFNLNSMEENQKYHDKKGVYTRTVGERYLLVEPFNGNWGDLMQKEMAGIELFYHAQENYMAPVFPAGMLIRCDTDPVTLSFWIQVLHPPKEDGRILHVPKTEFSCLQADLSSETDLPGLIKENFSIDGKKYIIISNMLLDKIHFSSRHTEIQVPV